MATSSQRVLGRDPVTGRGLVVEVEGGMIRSVEFAEHGDQRWLCAGFVDLQVNGADGAAYDDPDERFVFPTEIYWK